MNLILVSNLAIFRKTPPLSLNGHNFFNYLTFKTFTIMSINLKKTFGAVLNQFKNQFIPTKDTNLRMTWGGAIAVEDKKNEGFYIAIDADGKMRRYPEAMTMKLPVFFINKPVAQVKAGDVIKQGNSYFNVSEIKNGNIKTRSYTGFAHTVLPVEDVLIGSSMIPVAINLFGAFGNGQTNPLAAANGAAQGGLFGGLFGGGQNNMMQMMLMSQLMGGGDLFGGSDSSDEEFVDDEFSSMDRRDLKFYQQRNNLGVKVFPSMSDEDLRNKIRTKLGRPTSDSCECGGTMEMLMMSQIMGGGQMNGMNPLALMMLSGKGGDSNDMMMLLMMSQMGMLQNVAPAAPAATPAPEVINEPADEAPTENAQ